MTTETEAAIDAALAALDLAAYQRRRVRVLAVDLADRYVGDITDTITRVNRLRNLCRKLNVEFNAIESAAMPTTTPPPRRNLIILPPDFDEPVEARTEPGAELRSPTPGPVNPTHPKSGN
jgi:hypothetical protein